MKLTYMILVSDKPSIGRVMSHKFLLNSEKGEGRRKKIITKNRKFNICRCDEKIAFGKLMLLNRTQSKKTMSTRGLDRYR